MSQKVLLLNARLGEFNVDITSIPKPDPGTILVKVKAVALNPADWQIWKTGILVEKFPAVLGHDVAGDVEVIGTGVHGFRVGDRVLFQCPVDNKYAGFQQYTLAIATAVAKIPSNISYDEASTVPVGLTTAYVGLYNQKPNGFGLVPPVTPDGKGKYAREPIFILGGSSSVGQSAIQLAKLSGFWPIITTASIKNVDYLKSIGASNVIDRRSSASALAYEIQVILHKMRPIKYAFDAISTPETQQIAYDVVAPGGQLALTRAAVMVKSEERGVDVFRIVGLPRHLPNIELLETLYHDHLERLLEEGDIKPNCVEVLPNGLAGIPDGLKRLEEEEISRLKLVARPQETP